MRVVDGGQGRPRLRGFVLWENGTYRLNKRSHGYCKNTGYGERGSDDMQQFAAL